MILESMTVEGLYIISVALSATGKWQAAGRQFNRGSKVEGWLTGLAVVALIISEILLFWVFNKYKRSEQQLNKKITDMSVANIKLKQEKEKSKVANEKLRQKLADLKAVNEKLRKERAQLIQSA